MAVSVTKRTSKPSKRLKSKRLPFWDTAILFKFLSRVPAAILLLSLLFLWSSSTTIFSGSVVHLCVSSRKLNDLYCLSAGAQPNFKIPAPANTLSSTNPNNSGTDTVELTVPHDSIAVTRKRIEGNGDLEVENAIKVVEEQVKLHRSWSSNASDVGSCDGRGVFVYDLPTRFNEDLVSQCAEMVPWMNLCKFFENEALGQPIPALGKGYHTHQYSLEPIFHSRILNHPCRVHNPDEAKLFYVPFYGGLHILRWHFKNASDDAKDALGFDLVNWLQSQSPWARHSGKDHVFVLGKVSWDFRRTRSNSWGTRFLELDQMRSPIKLLIERQPWESNDVGIPHPTHFHPSSDHDIVHLQSRILQSPRRTLIAFAGAARPGSPENIRDALIKQCENNLKCRFLNCDSGGCDRPESVIELFMGSEFCLQPPGDSPTRKSVFDSLVSGCIPVIFDPFTAYYQYPWHLPEDGRKYSVFIDQQEVRGGMGINVVEKLIRVPEREREGMRRFIAYELLPGLVYADSSSKLQRFHDAFSIAVNNLLQRVSTLE